MMLHLAHAFYDTGNLTEASQIYNQISQSCDDDARLHNNLGEIYLVNNQEKEAIESFKKAINRDVSAINPLVKLGDLYLKKHYFDGAMEMYKQALQINPDDPVLIEKFNSLARYRRENS